MLVKLQRQNVHILLANHWFPFGLNIVHFITFFMRIINYDKTKKERAEQKSMFSPFPFCGKTYLNSRISLSKMQQTHLVFSFAFRHEAWCYPLQCFIPPGTHHYLVGRGRVRLIKFGLKVYLIQDMTIECMAFWPFRVLWFNHLAMFPQHLSAIHLLSSKTLATLTCVCDFLADIQGASGSDRNATCK